MKASSLFYYFTQEEIADLLRYIIRVIFLGLTFVIYRGIIIKVICCIGKIGKGVSYERIRIT